MKIWIDRNVCESNLAACESCFRQLVTAAVPDQPCILAYRDDGRETLTIFLHSKDHDEMLIIPPEMRERVAYDGWRHYLSLQPGLRRNEGPQRLQGRRVG